MDRKERIKNYQEQMIKDLARLVSFDSKQGETTQDAPFGEMPKKCLLEALKILDENKIKNVNLDNYIGYGEVGEGQEIVGVLGHLDIVPAGEGWNTDPFKLTLNDNKLFGRGTSDDKGAMIAALYAIKVLQDEDYNFKKRVRLIFGTNEETGSKCLAHYVEKEGHFTYGFTPDANFPGVYGEKGMISALFSSNKTRIISINGGVASNVVCNKCITILPADFCDFDKLEEYFHNNKLEYSLTKNENVELIVNGVSAHASTPHLGVNAISHTFKALEYANSNDELVKKYNSCIGLETDGSLCNIKYQEKYGALTFNVGVIQTKDNQVSGTIDIRSGLLCDNNQLIEKMSQAFKEHDFDLTIKNNVQPLFFEPNSPMVKSLVSAYQEVTKDYKTQPMTMGGGTYAKGINNCIGFGCEFPNDDNHIHDANEFVKLDDWLLQVEIYAQAIQNLCEL